MSNGARKHCAVIGLGKFGSTVAEGLARRGFHVLAIDEDEDRVRAVADKVAVAVVLDAMDQNSLKDVGIKDIEMAIVSIGQDVEANILVVTMLKEMGVKEIIAKAVSDLHAKVLMHLGVSRIVQPERDMAQRLAESIANPDVLETIHLSADYSIVEFAAPKFLVGKTIRDSALRAEYGLSIIAVKSVGPEGDKLEINPDPTKVIEQGQLIVVLGRNARIEKLRSMT